MVPGERSRSYSQLYRPMSGKELFMLPYMMQPGILETCFPRVRYVDWREAQNYLRSLVLKISPACSRLQPAKVTEFDFCFACSTISSPALDSSFEPTKIPLPR